MFKRKKKKTGCETPEFRKTVPPPPRPEPKPGARLKRSLTQICGKLCDQADEIAKQMDESGFEKPTLVIKLFSDETVTVYINEEDSEMNYTGGTENNDKP